MTIKGYRDLKVWQKGMELANLVYDITELFPKQEQYGLTSQLRRSALSVPSNIAEGSARHGTKKFIQFLNIAKGSLAEMETQLLFAVRRKYITEEKSRQILCLSTEIDNMLYGLINKLKQKL